LVFAIIPFIAASKMSTHLTFNEHPFLKDLGLSDENPGVFHGKWGGSGDFVTTYNPTTGAPIAR